MMTEKTIQFISNKIVHLFLSMTNILKKTGKNKSFATPVHFPPTVSPAGGKNYVLFREIKVSTSAWAPSWYFLPCTVKSV